MAQVVKPWVQAAKKWFLIGGILAVLFIVLNSFGLLTKFYKKSSTIAAVDLPTAPANAKTSGLKFFPLPESTPTAIQGITPTLELMAWNAQQGLILANGGVTTTVGSLFEKYGIKLKIVRQDAGSQSATNLIEFAKAYQANPVTLTGTQMFIMMGDGYPQQLASLNKILLTLDKGKGEYVAEVVTAVGKSFGEDALLAPASWRTDPQKARGALVSLVVLDGDHNVILKWAADNAIPVNTDEKTYDPNAINFVNAENNDFLKSADRYIAGKPVTLKLVNAKGKAIKDTDVMVNAVCTWSPGDINIADKKGGLVRIVSTHEYASQMPAVVVTIKKFAEDHASYIENFIRATTDGGDQVKSFSVALDKASELSGVVYNDKNTDWKKLDVGYTTTDKQGLQVDLGGSAQYNLADVATLFGLGQGLNPSTSVYSSVYNTFSKIDLSLYPERFKDTPFVPYDKAVDLTYLNAVLNSKDVAGTSASIATYSTSTSIGQVVAKKSWHIEFATGSATLTPQGEVTASELYDDLVQNALKVELDGSTDNSGTDAVNQPLSLARATAVKSYLQAKSPVNFPESRFIVQGLGSTKPVASNDTKSGQAKNRRVDVLMGTN